MFNVEPRSRLRGSTCNRSRLRSDPFADLVIAGEPPMHEIGHVKGLTMILGCMHLLHTSQTYNFKHLHQHAL